MARHPEDFRTEIGPPAERRSSIDQNVARMSVILTWDESPEMNRLTPVIGSIAVARISLLKRAPPVAVVLRTSKVA